MVGPGANDHNRHRKHLNYQSIKILQQNNDPAAKQPQEEEEEEEEEEEISGFWS